MSSDKPVKAGGFEASADAVERGVTSGASGGQTVDRGRVIGEAMAVTARWAGRFIVVSIAIAILFWLLSRIWVGVLPVLLALIVSTLLAGPVAWLKRHGWPAAAAAGVTLLLSVVVVLGTLAAIAPSIIGQVGDVVDKASAGIGEVLEWLGGPPINLENAQIDSAIKEATAWLQERGTEIASGVFTGVSAVTSGVVTLALTLVLTFFFIKDGPAFLPWLRRASGHTAGQHLTEILTRVWRTLGGFIRTQAVVSAVDAVFIGLGLVILGVPLAPALAILTFMAGFVPILGAVVAGALAVLVALVSNGWATALWVLGIVLLVQQLESNVLQPLLQSRTMQMHPVIILLSVAAGGTLFGIPGAFLAVPVAAAAVVALRYFSEQIDLRTGDLHHEDLRPATPEGAMTALDGELAARHHRPHAEDVGADRPEVAGGAATRRATTGVPWLDRVRARLHRPRS